MTDIELGDDLNHTLRKIFLDDASQVHSKLTRLATAMITTTVLLAGEDDVHDRIRDLAIEAGLPDPFAHENEEMYLKLRSRL